MTSRYIQDCHPQPRPSATTIGPQHAAWETWSAPVRWRWAIGFPAPDSAAPWARFGTGSVPVGKRWGSATLPRIGASTVQHATGLAHVVPPVNIVVSVVIEPAKLPFRQRRKTRRLIRTLRRHRDAATRQYAAGNLARTGDPSATKALADAAAHDDSPYVRNSALACLTRLDAKSCTSSRLSKPGLRGQRRPRAHLLLPGGRPDRPATAVLGGTGAQGDDVTTLTRGLFVGSRIASPQQRLHSPARRLIGLSPNVTGHRARQRRAARPALPGARPTRWQTERRRRGGLRWTCFSTRSHCRDQQQNPSS
ncbi:HEAT repeat domain-containing protein [Spirillospora sp. CA-142024]|uniref:HEAT repeat domain-containing protein n=1 Tax=Spirillospora sp. CA-142024 TaxID=3240036 RepID=UPI003D8C520A